MRGARPPDVLPVGIPIGKSPSLFNLCSLLAGYSSAFGCMLI